MQCAPNGPGDRAGLLDVCGLPPPIVARQLSSGGELHRGKLLCHPVALLLVCQAIQQSGIIIGSIGGGFVRGDKTS